MDDFSSLRHWADYGLAPGESMSQSSPLPPIRAILPCPPPTLDTQEFEAQRAVSGDEGSALDSFAEYDLAPGEARTQCASREYSQLPPGPPATLDTQEFEKEVGGVCGDVWRVEDSLGCEELDHYNSEHLLDPPLDSPEVRINDVRGEEVWVVEDSLPCWENTTRGENRQDMSTANDLVPSSVPKAAGPDFAPCLEGGEHQEDKPSLRSVCSEQQGSKRFRSEEKPVRFVEGRDLSLVRPRLSSDLSESALRPGELEVKTCDGIETREKVDPASSPKFASRAPVSASVPKAWGENEASTPGGSPSPVKCSSRIVTDAVPTEVRTQTRGEAPVDSNSFSAGPTRHAGSALVKAENAEEGCECKLKSNWRTRVDSEDGLSPPKRVARTLLDECAVISRKRVENPLGEWRCPRDGKKFFATSRQSSLDRWLS